MVKIGTLLVNFERREIQRNGLMLRVSARAFDILEVLFRANGSIVTKDKIIEAVWRNQIVEENCLQVHVAALRKVLDADRELIKTVNGRGYMLVPFSGVPREAAVTAALPPITPLIGRDEDVSLIRAQLRQTPVVTLVGAGGIGKTALAYCIARTLSEEREGSVHFVELASSTSREAVIATLAVALQADPSQAMRDPRSLLSGLHTRRAFLVLDNAEHVIDSVAGIVEALISGPNAPGVLVTSREPLAIRGEAVIRVEPLPVPPRDASSEEILAYGAVEMFLLRARNLAPGCASDAASIHLVADICRRLEGLPLAIELAAARVATLGVKGVAARLDDRLNLLSGGLRSALPRHQTLRATFDWSYGLLDAEARAVFRCLAFFSGAFTFDAVCSVALEPGVPIAVAIASLGELAAKSLLAVEFHGAIALYRLTESTRAYAMEKLRDGGEVKRVAYRHLRYLQRQIEDRSALTPYRTEGQPLGHPSLDEARSAWDWAFSAEGDPALGVALAGSLVGTLLDTSHAHECRERAEHALATLDSLPIGTIDAVCEMRLCSAYAASLILTGGTASDAARLWNRVLERAQSSDHEIFAARAQWGLWNVAMTSGDIHAALRFATRFDARAQSEGTPWQKLCASATLAATLHCFGEHAQARERLERTLCALETLGQPAHEESGLAVDPRIFGTGTLARIAWLQGDTALALQLVERAINFLRADILEPSLCHLLAVLAVPLELACGEIEAASHHIGLLRSQAALNRFDGWQDYGQCLAGQLELETGNPEGLKHLEAGLAALASRGYRRLTAPLICTYAQALAERGRIEEAITKLDDAQRHCEAHGDLGFAAELVRVRGVVELANARRHQARGSQSEMPYVEAGRRYLREAMALAREQSARLFELRAALDLGESFAKSGDAKEALAVLRPFSAFTPQACGTPRLPEARKLADLFSLLQANAVCAPGAS
ncbi:winged helix-turn-helix domain-containing protein [Trinickia caryophylli]|uniref:Predicted ATPase n=1 Tax=Trinickia caryophylli TaxID=28094 RepID=A0A1X7CXQ5_TRICW|nr:winged helix-turn-helix domain-containing protein [Trinickia caryophylli]PMS13617.1 transcriptional regulator [Trinickia caryophylli]TRX13671.1 AAA family ATPase [Trinickia caryophylli]WQE15254.1 winged helix-turn-helix domain-containing protein [Trinickia caryophylli]SMF05029.1 Predicted ATPase [Trinickia caryophylli]GLU30998.1 transcriptional regulator [Trinickia caryophylli]